MGSIVIYNKNQNLPTLAVIILMVTRLVEDVVVESFRERAGTDSTLSKKNENYKIEINLVRQT